MKRQNIEKHTVSWQAMDSTSSFLKTASPAILAITVFGATPATIFSCAWDSI